MASPFYDNYNVIIDRGRKDRAYEALRSVYGDIAGDPESATRMQQYGERERIAPGEWEAQQQALELGRQKIGQGSQAEKDAAMQRRRTALLNGAQYVVSAMDRAKDAGASEGSIMDAAIVAFNRVAPSLGMSEEDIQSTRDALASDPNSARDTVAMLLGNDASAAARAQAAQQPRYQIVQQPDGTIVRVPITGVGEAETVTVGNQPVRGYQAPQAQERLVQGQQRIDIASPEGQRGVYGARELGKGEGKRQVEDLPLSGTGLASAQATFDAAMQGFQVADTAAKNAMDNASWLNTGPLAALPDFINPAAAAQRADLITAMTGPVLTGIQQMREAGKAAGSTGTGFGQLTEKELALLEARWGAVLQAASPPKFKSAVEDFRKQLAASQGRVRRAYEADLKARGQGAPAQGSRVEGENVILKWNPEKGDFE